MKARSNIIGKFFCLFLLAALALRIYTPVLAASDTAILSTTVPSHFDMNVTIVGNGTVEVNGVKLTGTSVILAERNKEVAITLSPNDGSHIASVIYAGTDITSAVQDVHITLPHLE